MVPAFLSPLRVFSMSFRCGAGISFTSSFVKHAFCSLPSLPSRLTASACASGSSTTTRFLNTRAGDGEKVKAITVKVSAISVLQRPFLEVYRHSMGSIRFPPPLTPSSTHTQMRPFLFIPADHPGLQAAALVMLSVVWAFFLTQASSCLALGTLW